ncbi:hypothetical protein ONZ45_g4693 [Pleurotus djamor]|nr:hypothetical protein ONZ45_g4693 [Pleurotus djamor]
MFKLPRPDKWMVVVCSPRLVSDLWRASDDDISFTEAIDDVRCLLMITLKSTLTPSSAQQLQIRHTMGPTIMANSFHVKVLLTTMARNLSVRFSDLHEEVSTTVERAVGDALDWKSVPAHQTVLGIVSRVSGRILVGDPLCWNEDYMSLNIEFARNVVVAASIINRLPSFLQRFVGQRVSPLPSAYAKAQKHLTPLIAQRIREDEELGKDRFGRPNDMISWLLDGIEEPYQLDPEYLTLRILMINFASIHTTSQNLTQALFNIAAYPQHMQKLRDEVQHTVRTFGWTKEAIDKMVHVDSFLRETLRLNSSLALTMVRKVINPEGFRFSDGTVLPYGTLAAVPVKQIHRDEEYSGYADAATFDGFRFVSSESKNKHLDTPPNLQLAVPSQEFLTWGHGRHACPGRFFAALQMKTILAYIILHFDVKLQDASRPVDECRGWRCHVNPSATLSFKRVAAEE